MLSLALVGFIWQLIYSRDQGLLNAITRQRTIDWYGDPDVNLWAVLVAGGWRHTGYIMLLYLAGPEGGRPVAARGGRGRRRDARCRRSSGSSSR